MPAGGNTPASNPPNPTNPPTSGPNTTTPETNTTTSGTNTTPGTNPTPATNMPSGQGTHNTALSVIDLPLPGSKGAPKKFKGHHSEVERFLYFYERLCRKYNVTVEQEKVENLTQYCSRSVREFLEGLKSYGTGSWTAFREDFRKYFDVDKDVKRYKVKDLEKFVKQRSKTHKIIDIEGWIKYNRAFIRIAGWLQRNNKVTGDEYNLYYWKGINHSLRARLESRIMSQNPTHDLADPFDAATIAKAAESLLKRDRFDNDRLPTDDDDTEINIDSDESDSDSSDSSDVDDRRRKSRRSHSSSKKSAKRQKKVSFKDTKKTLHESSAESDSDNDGSTISQRQQVAKERKPPASRPAQSAGDAEVEELIRRMENMSLDDPSYATAYFRAVSMNPIVKDIVPSPKERRRTFTATPPNGGRNFQREPPPHLAREPPMGTSIDDFRCIGCSDPNHRMSDCPQLNEFIAQGKIKRNALGRFVMADNRFIRRNPGENLVDAIKRTLPPTSNYISVSQTPWDERESADTHMARYDGYAVQQGYDSDSDDSDEEQPEAYPVTRTSKSTTSARKERMESVTAPPPKHKAPTTEYPAKDKGKEKARPVVKGPPGGPPGFRPTPIEVHRQLFDEDDSDVIMEDVSLRPKKKPVPQATTSAKPDAKDLPAKPVGDAKAVRKSEVQMQANPRELLERLLNAPITIGIGDLLAVSKPMTQMVQDSIRERPRPGPEKAVVHAAQASDNDVNVERPMVATATFPFAPRTRGHLIKVKMHCEGVSMIAIIDTGSQLNIVHKRVWQHALRYPMDLSRKIVMNDANGGEGLLQGFIPDVPLTCGSVVTLANVYIGDNAPFDLLLGRPWQRGNFVSIDERANGTYLLFKDKHMRVRFEMLATPDMDMEPAVSEYIARASGMLCTADDVNPPTAHIEEVHPNMEPTPPSQALSSSAPPSPVPSSPFTYDYHPNWPPRTRLNPWPGMFILPPIIIQPSDEPWLDPSLSLLRRLWLWIRHRILAIFFPDPLAQRRAEIQERVDHLMDLYMADAPLEEIRQAVIAITGDDSLRAGPADSDDDMDIDEPPLASTSDTTNHEASSRSAERVFLMTTDVDTEMQDPPEDTHTDEQGDTSDVLKTTQQEPANTANHAVSTIEPPLVPPGLEAESDGELALARRRRRFMRRQIRSVHDVYDREIEEIDLAEERGEYSGIWITAEDDRRRAFIRFEWAMKDLENRQDWEVDQMIQMSHLPVSTEDRELSEHSDETNTGIDHTALMAEPLSARPPSNHAHAETRPDRAPLQDKINTILQESDGRQDHAEVLCITQNTIYPMDSHDTRAS